MARDCHLQISGGLGGESPQVCHAHQLFAWQWSIFAFSELPFETTKEWAIWDPESFLNRRVTIR
jgi:hypothetical protein